MVQQRPSAYTARELREQLSAYGNMPVTVSLVLPSGEQLTARTLRVEIVPAGEPDTLTTADVVGYLEEE